MPTRLYRLLTLRQRIDAALRLESGRPHARPLRLLALRAKALQARLLVRRLALGGGR